MRLWLAGALLLALAAASCLIGATDLFSGKLDTGMLLMVSRIPRTCAAILAGAGLALAGVIVQVSVQNRLVEPSLVGTPEAAVLGLLAITMLAPGATPMAKMWAATAGAFAGTLVFLALARHVPRRDPVLLPLVGLVYAGILTSAGLWIAWSADMLQFIGIWLAGDFSGVLQGRYELLWLIAPMAVLLYLAADRITLLGLGEEAAKSLGLNYHQTRLLGLALVSVAVAVVVVSVGTIPFIGLIVPNIVSIWRGDNLRRSLPAVAWLGAVLVLGCDIAGRLIRWPYEIPAGVLVAVLGAAVFLWLLNAPPRRARRA